MKKITTLSKSMNQLTIAVFVFCFFNTVFMKAQSPGDWQFAVKAGGSNADVGKGIAVDGTGNSYVIGYFDLTSTFYGTPNITLTTNGSTDIFIAKYDPSGNVLWAKKAGGIGADQGASISIDNSGNSYVTGVFFDTATFYGSTDIKLISNGSNDIFIAKYDPNGNVLWAKKAGGSGADYSYKIKNDNSGNTYIAGFFPNDTLIFYGTPNISLMSNGQNDICIAKFDPNGNVIWAKHAGGITNDNAYGIAIDGSGNSFVTGAFLNTAYFYGASTVDSVLSQGSNDIFVAKFDVNGNELWVRHAGSNNADFGNNIAVDAASNCYISGTSNNNCIFFGPPSNITLASNGFSDVFVASYNASGNMRWVKHAGGTGFEFANGISFNPNGDHVIVGGCFQNTGTFYGLININLSSAGSSDAFLAEYDAATGNVLCAQSGGGTSYDRTWDVACDGMNSYVTGEFSGTATFTSTTPITLTGTGTPGDVLLGKWLSSCFVPAGIVSPGSSSEIALYPNPASGFITLETNTNNGKETHISVYDMLGKQISTRTVVLNSSFSLDISALPKGIYFIKAENEKGSFEKKFIVQ